LTNRPRVEDLLSRLSATGYGDKLRLAGQGGFDGILRGLLRELDTAVLPRLLAFGGADGPLIEIEAANRRVLGFGAIGGDMAPVDAEAEASAKAFRAFLDKNLKGATKLYVSQSVPATPMDASGSGISASVVAEAWGLSLAPAGLGEPSDALDTLMSRSGDRILAWLIEAEDENAASGEPDAVEVLEALAASDRAADLLGVAAGEEPWQFLAVADPAAEGFATVLARVGEVRVLLALPDEHLADIAQLWHEIMTG
jgi:hypothetical protein